MAHIAPFLNAARLRKRLRRHSVPRARPAWTPDAACPDASYTTSEDEGFVAAGNVHALLLAGQRPGQDPLAAHFGMDLKALIPIAGEPMVSRVARTLLNHPAIGRLTILAQEVDRIAGEPGCAWLARDPRVTFATAADTISGTVAYAMGAPSHAAPVLVTTADHALLTCDMIDDFLAQAYAARADVSAAVVGRKALVAVMPDARRTWLPFRDQACSGANLFLLSSARARLAVEFWSSVESDRKKARRILSAFGVPLAIAVALRLLTLRQAMMRAGYKLGVTATAVVMNDPIACIDVDKPSDHALATRLLEARA